jgi:hypothetical protein
MRETSLDATPEPGTDYVDSVCQMASDPKAARGIRVYQTGTRQLHVAFTVGWLSSSARAGVIGNVTYGDLRQVMDDGHFRYLFGPFDDPWWKVFGRRRRRVSKSAADAAVVAVLAVRAWCNQIGMSLPTMSTLDVTGLQWRSGPEVRGLEDGLWHATVAGADLGGEVVVAPHEPGYQTIPVSVWATSGPWSVADTHTDEQA